MAAFLPMIASAVSGGLNFAGAVHANNMNKRLAREQMSFQREANQKSMDFSRQSAHEQMGFQERMSNTAYQRAMQDMRSAGINPIVAFNQGGASSPSGSAPGGQTSGGASAHMSNTMSGALSSAIDARRTFAEIKNLEEQNKNLQAQNKQINSQTLLNKSSAQSVGVDAELKRKKLPAAEFEKNLDEGWFGKTLRVMERLNPFSSFLKTFKPK